MVIEEASNVLNVGVAPVKLMGRTSVIDADEERLSFAAAFEWHFDRNVPKYLKESARLRRQ